FRIPPIFCWRIRPGGLQYSPISGGAGACRRAASRPHTTLHPRKGVLHAGSTPLPPRRHLRHRLRHRARTPRLRAVARRRRGGTVHFDLPRDVPEALQHRHPPERGLRHAINVLPDTKLAGVYGEGEVVVNSEHRRAVARVARGFRVSAQALDGVTEAIEAENSWFALGVQWQPASATASGLDIQLFRGLVQACKEYAGEEVEVAYAGA